MPNVTLLARRVPFVAPVERSDRVLICIPSAQSVGILGIFEAEMNEIGWRYHIVVPLQEKPELARQGRHLEQVDPRQSMNAISPEKRMP